MAPLGPVIVDLISTDLSLEEKEILQHPLIGGVILFSRNYENIAQLTELCKAIRAVRPALLIGVDQEGGRVQRFKEGFTRLPPMGELGKLYEINTLAALEKAKQLGSIMAAELLAVGLDFSFAPVLDLNKELNTVIGDRAFHCQPHIVSLLAKALMKGMHQAGMAATGKHFPGHGSVTVDSHLVMPIDGRDFSMIFAEDLQPFKELIASGLDAIMPAHILFPKIDTLPVGFSEKWLKEILRKQLQFSGVIFSDDLNMEGAGIVGGYQERAEAALKAGCDFVLICNNRAGAVSILEGLSPCHVPIEKVKNLKKTL